MAKSAAKRLERVEEICLGMGFLLLKLRQTYGSDFGVGMTEQVDQAIRDYRQLEAVRIQRARRGVSEILKSAKATGSAS